MPLIRNYRALLALLEPAERRQYAVLAGVSLLLAFLDLVSIAAIVPFLAIASRPEIIESNRFLRQFAQEFGLVDRTDVLIVLAAMVFVVVIVSIVGRAVVFHFLMRFSRLRALSLAMKLMRRFLQRGYLWHIGRDSADLARKALDEVREVVNGPLNASLRLIANSAVFVLVIALLIALEPIAALAAALLMVLCYGTTFLLIQRQLATMGRDWQSGNAYRYRIMQEALGGIREVKLFGLQDFYLSRYHGPAEKVAQTRARINTLSEMPRYVLEAVAFGGMLLFLILLLASGNDIATIVPILGAYAIAGVRLFPIVQSIYRDYTIIQTNEALVESLLDEVVDDETGETPAIEADRVGVELPFDLSLALRDVSFSFPGADQPTLSHCSVIIDRGSVVGFAGATGAGKSTLIDIMAGLIPPDRGQILLDDVAIDARNSVALRNHIGFVSQSIFLVEDTLAHNIAFGAAPEEVDHERVRQAAKLAQIDAFIASLPDGYQTRAGERGKRLSGGQRQRIAIARALYRQPSLLIFDEATSALDPATEIKVMRAIMQQANSASIVLIAHRLATLQSCDVIHVLDQGRIVASGSYEDLNRSSAVFRALQGAED